MSFSPILSAYRIATTIAGAFANAYLGARAREGKEDAGRIGERFGRYTQTRPAGTLAWLHGASVGESGVALQLIEALAARDPSLSFLLSTGTRTSADLVARRAPPRTTHVYAPIDRGDAVRRFLRFWRPDLGVFVESELWPNLIMEAEKAGVKLALVNARMSPKTLRRWENWRAAARRLSGAFALTLAADTRTAEALTRMRGKPTPALGNLKLAAPALRVDATARETLRTDIGGRAAWLAASTHAGEDEIILAAHEKLRAEFPSALLIIAPRHPERGEAIAALAGGAPRRSKWQAIKGAPVYVADTLGEMGLFYELAPASFIAGSLLPTLKGHNPAEPAKQRSAIMTGPYVESFQDLFDALISGGGAIVARTPEEIAHAIGDMWRDEALRARRVAAAAAIVDQGASAFGETVAQLVTLLPAQQAAARTANASA